MSRFLAFYTVLLFAFAVFLAYQGVIWFSAFVLILSFLGYALLVGQVIKKLKKQ